MKLFLPFVLAGVFTTSAFGAVINEIRIDQPSGDLDEYFELLGTPGESLDGLTYVVIGDGATGSGTVEMALSLTGLSIGSGGYFLAAEDADTLGILADFVAASALNFENSDNVTHALVSGFTGAVADDLDIDDDGTLDSTPWTSVLDAVSLVETIGSGDQFYGSALGGADVGPDGSFVPAHVYRRPDGGDWAIGPFDPTAGDDTPGAENIPEPSTVLLGGIALLLGLRRRR